MTANRDEIIATETARLNMREDTDDNNDSFTSDVEVDLEEDEIIIEEDQQSQL